MTTARYRREGGLLTELAALVLAGSRVDAVEFADGEAALTTEAGTVAVPVAADRDDLARALAAPPVPPFAEQPYRSDPWAELLYDLGSHAMALVDYRDTDLTYRRVHRVGSEVTITVHDHGSQRDHQVLLSLSDPWPPVGMPYTIADRITDHPTGPVHDLRR